MHQIVINAKHSKALTNQKSKFRDESEMISDDAEAQNK